MAEEGVETVRLPKDELFAMLDIADEMVRFCSVSMPADRYYATASAIWVIAHRATGNDADANRIKEDLLQNRERWLHSQTEVSPT